MISTGRAANHAARAARSPFVVLLAVSLFINYVDRGLLPTAAPLLVNDLHFNEGQLGILFSAFFWTYAIIQIPIGWVAERFGAERVLAAGLLLWGGATMLTGAASAFATLIVLRLLLGLGESTGFPCVSKLLAAKVPVESLATANGLVAFGYLLGPAVGTYFGAWVMADFGWRSAFVVFGALSLVWLWPWSHVALRPIKVHAPESGGPSLRAILEQRALWGAVLGHFSINYTYYLMLTWLPFILVKERGFSLGDMAKLAGAAYVVTAFSAYIGGWTIDRFISRGVTPNFAHKLTMAIAHGGAVLCMLGLALGPRPVAVASIFIYQILLGGSAPSVYAIPQILAGVQATGRWVGIQNAIGNFAGVVAPAATGFIAQSTGHFTVAFTVGAAISLFGLIGWVFIVPKLEPLRWVSAPPAAASPSAGLAKE